MEEHLPNAAVLLAEVGHPCQNPPRICWQTQFEELNVGSKSFPPSTQPFPALYVPHAVAELLPLTIPALSLSVQQPPT